MTSDLAFVSCKVVKVKVFQNCLVSCTERREIYFRNNCDEVLISGPRTCWARYSVSTCVLCSLPLHSRWEHRVTWVAKTEEVNVFESTVESYLISDSLVNV